NLTGLPHKPDDGRRRLFQVVWPVEPDLIILLEHILTDVRLCGCVLELIPARDGFDQGWNPHTDSIASLIRFRFRNGNLDAFTYLERHSVGTFPNGNGLETHQDLVHARFQSYATTYIARISIEEMFLAFHMDPIQP